MSLLRGVVPDDRGEATRTSAEINLPFLAATSKGPIHFNVALTRQDLAQLEA